MTKQDIFDLFQSIDDFDAKKFVSYLDEDANFKFGNMPVVSGKQNIHDFVDGFFKSIQGIRHSNLEVWSVDGVRFANGTVTYTRHDGSELTVDYSNTFKLKDNKIKDYLIFVDNHELYQ